MGAKLKPDREPTETELHFLDAAANGDLAVVRAYLTGGGDINVGDHRGMPWGITALMHACQQGHKSIVEELLAAGANWRLKDYGPPGEGGGNTALHYAANSGNLEIVKLLLAKGAKIDAKSGSGSTLLLSAAFNGNIELIRFALAAGAKINQQDSLRANALCWAAQMGHLEIIRLLLDYGADPNGLDSSLDSPPLVHAIQGTTLDRPEVAKTLIEAGADVQRPSEDGLTPLEWAIRAYAFTVISILVDARCDVNLRFQNGRLPMDVAVEYSLKESSSPARAATNKIQWEEVFRILRKAGAKSDHEN